MIFGGLNQYDGEDPDSQDLVKYWHPEMQWHGPRGVGSSLGLDEFRQRTQGPILKMVPDRKGVGHRARIAEGHYAAYDRLAGLGGHDDGRFPRLASFGAGDALEYHGFLAARGR